MASRPHYKDEEHVEVKAAKSLDDEKKSSAQRSVSPETETRYVSGNKDHRDSRRRSRSRSPHRRHRSQSRERRRSRSRDRGRDRDRKRFFDRSSRKYSPGRSKVEDHGRYKQPHYRRRRSRSASTERMEKEQERSKLAMRQQLARNYEKLEELKNSQQYGPPAQMYNKFPNQVHVEPSKLVEQIEKRKFLFKKDKPAEAATTSNSAVWKNTALADDSDGKMTAKFKRLMGMKDGEAEASSTNTDSDSVQKQNEYFANLEKQYEVARATTHTQRGLGLGFSSGRIFPVHPKP